MIFKTQWNAEAFPSKGEINRFPSETIPDQSLTVREIMQRYAQGLPLEGERVPVYNGEDIDLPEFQYLDLAEREEYKNRVREEIVSLGNILKERKIAVEAQKKLKAEQKAKISLHPAQEGENSSTAPATLKN